MATEVTLQTKKRGRRGRHLALLVSLYQTVELSRNVLVIQVINEQDFFFLGGGYSFRKQYCTDTFTENLRIQQCIKTHYFSWGLIAALNVEVLHWTVSQNDCLHVLRWLRQSQFMTLQPEGAPAGVFCWTVFVFCSTLSKANILASHASFSIKWSLSGHRCVTCWAVVLMVGRQWWFTMH